MKLERLYDTLREQWPGNKYELSAWLFGNLKEAWSLRGSTAHGNIIIEEHELGHFARCLYAAEAFAFFLLTHGLDLGADPGRKLDSGRLLPYFMHGNWAPPPKLCEAYEAKYPKYKFQPPEPTKSIATKG